MKRSQVGMLLETFILLLVVILFTLFWGNMSKNAFVAGLFKVDDSSLNHTCSAMAPAIVGTDYIMNNIPPSGEVAEVVNGVYNYLGYKPDCPIPDAKYFYERTTRYFPELENRTGIKIKVIRGNLPDNFIYEWGYVPKGNSFLLSLLGKRLSLTKCSFPLYSVNETLEAVIDLYIYV